MISQGGLGQGQMKMGYNCKASSGRMLETNTENLLRMVSIGKIPCVCFLSSKLLTLLAEIYFHILLLQVSYCENEVDCRRFLQLVHLGEKFDSTNCKNTCDNCSSSKILIDKDVTVIARQLVQDSSEVHHYFTCWMLYQLRTSIFCAWIGGTG